MEVRYFEVPKQLKELNEYCKGIHTWHTKINDNIVRVTKTIGGELMSSKVNKDNDFNQNR